MSLSIEHLFFKVLAYGTKLFENINIKVSLVRFKHSVKDFLVFYLITFRYDR